MNENKLVDQKIVTRGDLSEAHIKLLDRILRHHKLEESSPYKVPERLVYVCLNCGSIGSMDENATSEDRDRTVDAFDFSCCGLTVVFHSKHRVLVDPRTLGEPQQVKEGW